MEETAVKNYDRSASGEAVTKVEDLPEQGKKITPVGYTPRYSPFTMSKRKTPRPIGKGMEGRPPDPISIVVKKETPRIEEKTEVTQQPSSEASSYALSRTDTRSAAPVSSFGTNIKISTPATSQSVVEKREELSSHAKQKLEKIINIGSLLEEGQVERVEEEIEVPKKREVILREVKAERRDLPAQRPSMALSLIPTVVAVGILAVGLSSAFLNHDVSYLASTGVDNRASAKGGISLVSIEDIKDKLSRLIEIY